jgi:D-galactarolactone cycloisomerase
MPDILGEELNFLVVRVEAGGVVGYGEISDSYCCTYPLAYVPLVEDVLGALVKGESLEPVDLLIRRLNWYVRRRLGDHGMVKQAISGVEIALWDALGKLRGRSVAQMLGQVREAVPVYASGKFLDDGTAEYLHGLFRESLERGVRTVKVRASQDFRSDLRVLREVRELLGEEVDVLVDGNEHFSLFTARRYAKALAEEGVVAFEEPVPEGYAIAAGALSDRAPLPIIYGEHMYNEAEFLDLLTTRRPEVIQPDPAILGGISETVRITETAGRFGTAVIPHSAAGPLALAATLHVAAACPNVPLVEHSFTLESVWELLSGTTLSRSSIVDGALPVPSGPGLGLEIDEGVFEGHRCATNRYDTLGWERPARSVGHV